MVFLVVDTNLKCSVQAQSPYLCHGDATTVLHGHGSIHKNIQAIKLNILTVTCACTSHLFPCIFRSVLNTFIVFLKPKKGNVDNNCKKCAFVFRFENKDTFTIIYFRYYHPIKSLPAFFHIL